MGCLNQSQVLLLLVNFLATTWVPNTGYCPSNNSLNLIHIHLSSLLHNAQQQHEQTLASCVWSTGISLAMQPTTLHSTIKHILNQISLHSLGPAFLHNMSSNFATCKRESATRAGFKSPQVLGGTPKSSRS